MNEKNKNAIMLKLNKKRGVRIFRNNVGVAIYSDGRRVRYGLCPGSSDLIGWKSVDVTPDMIGKKVAVFLAVEIKAGKTTVKEHQDNFIDVVREFGGIAGVVRDIEDVDKIVKD